MGHGPDGRAHHGDGDAPHRPQRDPVPVECRLLQGRWQDEFSPADTRDRTFQAPSGPVERPMMSRTGGYGWMRAPGFQAVRLPYRGRRFAMYVLLPDADQGLAQLRERVTAEAWREWMGGFRPQSVHVVMPRYRLGVSSVLNDPLQAMGMADAFVPGRAELDAMLPAEYVAKNEPYVSNVLQKVFVEVNEEGTEAVAATAVEVRARGPAPRVREFVVDRPFILAVRDDQTGALLFIGQVNDPVTQ
ncbi:MAG TPA: serpin family protein [Longimicrobium sp.]|nr:serpin family protein [Longimicrobium sp.]